MNGNEYLRLFRSKEDEDPQERKLKEIKREIEAAISRDDIQAFDHASYKLKMLEVSIERSQENANRLGEGNDTKKTEDHNRKMLKAIDAKLSILSNL